jgi:hypothetical protein
MSVVGWFEELRGEGVLSLLLFIRREAERM